MQLSRQHLPAPDPRSLALQEQVTALLVNLRRVIAHRDRETAISRLDYSVLLRLTAEGAMRASDLAHAEGLDPSTMSRRLASLGERGLIEREVDPDDARARQISATADCRALVQAERTELVRQLTQALADWSSAELDQLTTTLTHLNESLVRSRDADPTPERNTA